MASIELASFAFDDAGAAISGATVNLYDRNTVTPVRATTTTNSSGYWTISHGTEGRFDVEIVNGATKRRHKYDDAVQLQEMEVANLLVRNPANTFKYDIVPAAIVADRALTLPLITGSDTLAALGLAQTFTATQTFATIAVSSNDGGAIGASGTAFSDLFLASGAVINFNAGDVTITHSSNTLTIGGGITVLATASTIGNLTLGDGSIVDSSGAISFGNENLTTTGTLASGALTVTGAGSVTTSMTAASVLATTNDSGAIGASGTAFSDLFLASGAVINFVGGDVTLTHSSNTLTLGGANELDITNGASTSNMVVTVENSTNSGASHSYMDIRVGGTTSSGDPHIRWTVPSGTSWYAGVDNSNVDALVIGTGTTVGDNRWFQLDPRTSGTGGLNQFYVNVNAPGLAINNGASAFFTIWRLNAGTGTLTGTTTVTRLWDTVAFHQQIIAQSGGTVVVNDATTLNIIPPTVNTSVTGTNVSAIRIRDAGTVNGTMTNQIGLYIESLTAGGTDYAIFAAGTPIIHASLPAASAATNVSLDSSNNLQQDTSWEGFKEMLGPWLGGSKFLRAITPSRYLWKEGMAVYETEDYGLTAQNVQNALTVAANEKDGHAWSIRHPVVEAALVGGWQEHDAKIKSLEAVVRRLKLRAT